MSKVLAKFVITGLESQRQVEHERNPETNAYEAARGSESCTVRMNAVQGEPFGRYTPSGTIQMSILNEAAARIFREAWQGYTASADPKAKAPEFYVTFKLDTGEGAD